MKPVTVGLIGAGFHARSVHIPCIDLVPQLRLGAIATSREETAREAAQRYRVTAYASYQELIERADVEAVIVATPANVFDSVCRMAVEHGKHVLVETGGIGTVPVARELLALAKKNRLTVQVAYSLRYAAPFDILKKHSDRAAGARIFIYDYYPFLSHIYNLSLYFSGPVERVAGAVRQPAGLTALLKFKNGDTATIIGRSVSNCSIGLESVTVSTETFYGAVEGRTRVRIVENMKSVAIADWSTESSAGLSFEPHVFGAQMLKSSGYMPQLSAFAAAIREGTPPRSDLSDAIETHLLIEAINQKEQKDKGEAQ